MTIISALNNYLLQEKIISIEEAANISISLMIGDAPKRSDILSKRYVISKNHKPYLNVKYHPKSWKFSSEDILKTRSLYAGFKSFKLPKLIGHYITAEGHFFIEEYLHSAVSLADCVDSGDLTHQKAEELVRNILSDIWSVAKPATKEFIAQEKILYRGYLKALIEESTLNDIVADYVDRVIDENADGLREVWSTGDILDRNILLSNGQWYLIDFDYCHKTIFLFKEAFRNVFHAKWAKNISLSDIFPYIGNFPLEAAKLISLAWERHLYSEILDMQANKDYQSNLRNICWDTIYPRINIVHDAIKGNELLSRQLENRGQSRHPYFNTGWQVLDKLTRIKNRIF